MISDILFIILLTLWAARSVRGVLWHVALWQHKEYRWDRMRAHLFLPGTERLAGLSIAKALLLFILLRWSMYAGAALTILYALRAIYP